MTSEKTTSQTADSACTAKYRPATITRIRQIHAAATRTGQVTASVAVRRSPTGSGWWLGRWRLDQLVTSLLSKVTSADRNPRFRASPGSSPCAVGRPGSVQQMEVGRATLAERA